jgi:hypothetical protein
MQVEVRQLVPFSGQSLRCKIVLVLLPVRILSSMVRPALIEEPVRHVRHFGTWVQVGNLCTGAVGAGRDQDATATVDANSREVSSNRTKTLARVMEADKSSVLVRELQGGTPGPIVATEMGKHMTPNVVINFQDEQV